MVEIRIVPIKKLYSILKETSIDNSVAIIASSDVNANMYLSHIPGK